LKSPLGSFASTFFSSAGEEFAELSDDAEAADDDSAGLSEAAALEDPRGRVKISTRMIIINSATAPAITLHPAGVAKNGRFGFSGWLKGV